MFESVFVQEMNRRQMEAFIKESAKSEIEKMKDASK